MRSLLPPEIQGEPAALVSAGCEVRQHDEYYCTKGGTITLSIIQSIGLYYALFVLSIII